jgi:gamma-glutamylcyclotransferase (GGCT)/AIG2-like uncharacterized protein YtfP
MSTDTPRPVFVYGTLLDQNYLSSLTGKRFRHRPAVLEGFERIVPNGGYPYIIRRAGSSVEGLVVFDLDSASLAILDHYESEGTLYLRRPVEVLSGGARVVCDTYVGNAETLKRMFGDAVDRRG